MGKESLHKYIMDFGFGKKTEIPLPAEARGTVHPVKRWGGQTITSVPMGHEISVTPLQLVMAMSAIANDGVLMKPMIVDHIENGEGKHVRHPKMPGDAFLPTEVRRAVSPRTARMMVQALKTVPRKNGTAPQAALEHYTVAGKTGTAQKVGVVGKTIEGKDIMGYKSGAYFASFCGFFPADDPELCILVLFDEPKHGYYGGTVAGPVFQRIARRAAKYLNIPPEPQLMKELELTGLAYGRTAKSRQ
jgi:cell division protein FtsI/penicillin-binding protein 2